MKKFIKLIFFNIIFSLIYCGLHFTFSMAFDVLFQDTPPVFMSVCYIVISLILFMIFGGLFKLENKSDYLKCFLIFCAISIIFCILVILFDSNLFVIFNTSPLFFGFGFEFLAFFFPIIEELELGTLVIMLIEDAIKILALYLGAKLNNKTNKDKTDQGTVL